MFETLAGIQGKSKLWFGVSVKYVLNAVESKISIEIFTK